MEVYLYRLSKKKNSTRRPAPIPEHPDQPYSGTTVQKFTCVLKDGCSVMNPVIMIENGLVDRPNFNYAYLEEFGRLYFITDWTFTRRLWVASLSVDVLATFKPTIGDLNLYILRAAADFNTYLTDGKFPLSDRARSYKSEGTSAYVTVDGVDIELPTYFNTTLGAGYYYLGVVGANGTGVNWYVMDAYGFNRLVQDLYAYTPSDMSDVSSGVAKQLADPLQYVVSTYWLPTLPNPNIPLQQDGPTVKFGDYSIRIYHANQFDPVTNIYKFHCDFTVRKHPQQSRGLWINQSPYSRYTLFFPPFGTFELDSSLMIDESTVRAEWYIDYSTGLADLLITATNSYLAHVNASYAVPIRLNQMTLDMYGGASSLVSQRLGFSSTTQVALSNIIGSVFGGVIPAEGGSVPKIGSKGSTGSFIPFKAIAPKIYSDFYVVADEDITDEGKPLYAKRTVRAIGGGAGGFMIAAKGTFEQVNAMENEIDQVNAYLEGGFYYE